MNIISEIVCKQFQERGARIIEENSRIDSATKFEVFRRKKEDGSRTPQFYPPSLSIGKDGTIQIMYTPQEVTFEEPEGKITSVGHIVPVQQITITPSEPNQYKGWNKYDGFLRSFVTIDSLYSFAIGEVWPPEKMHYALQLPWIGKQKEERPIIGTIQDLTEIHAVQLYQDKRIYRAIPIEAKRDLGSIVRKTIENIKTVGRPAFNELYEAYNHMKTIEVTLGKNQNQNQ